MILVEKNDLLGFVNFILLVIVRESLEVFFSEYVD